ncbi:MAG TPA: hypothetical protein DCM49_03985 [Lachnospiraceae bacterium]|nr:hypothetical protein [Lachnospiraceae bacterium]
MKITSQGRSLFCLEGSSTNEFSAFALENLKCRPQGKTFTMLFFMMTTDPFIMKWEVLVYNFL